MKMEPRSKEIRNIWTNPAILLDHAELEKSYNKFLEITMQRYNPERAAQGVLRSQRNVYQYLKSKGLLPEEAIAVEVDTSNFTSTSSVTSSLTNSVSTTSSSGSATSSSGRPVRSCTLTTPPTNVVPPTSTTAAVSQPKKDTKRKKSPLRGNKRENPGDKKACPKNNAAKQSNVSKSSSSSPTNTVDTTSIPNANESATVYQQQLLIKQLSEVVRCSEEQHKKHLAEIEALKSAANEYKKLLEDKSSSSTVTSNNKRKSLFNFII